MTTDEKPVFPLDNTAWERLMCLVIDEAYTDEENEAACMAIETIRRERTELIRRLALKEKK